MFISRISMIVATLIVIFFSAFSAGCASVPRESVDLSHAVGRDIEALHQSHRDVITRYFEALRAQVNAAIDDVFIPTYLNGFVTSGKLIQHAQSQRADLIEAWARIAVKRIDRERRERLQPLYEAERELLANVNEAFDKTMRANAAVTAQLASVVEVQQANDALLESVKLKDLRGKIHSVLAEASIKAAKITGDITSANAKIEKIN